MCSTDDDECPTGFMCVDLEPLGGCSICDDGEDIACTPAPCAENNLNVCSPIATECAEDSDCPAGFLCGEIGPFDLQTGWDESLVGTQGCLSIGLIAVTDGVVQGGQDVLPDGGVPNPEAGAGGSSGASAGSGGAGAGAGSGGSAGDAGSSGGAAGAEMMPAAGGGDSGGCSVGEPGSSRVLAAVMMLALLCGALLLRRWPIG
jgi:MYXO-CTERM domain-containing protein